MLSVSGLRWPTTKTGLRTEDWGLSNMASDTLWLSCLPPRLGVTPTQSPVLSPQSFSSGRERHPVHLTVGHADASAGVDALDRLADDRGDREDGELVDQFRRGERHGIGHDDLADRALLEAG